MKLSAPGCGDVFLANRNKSRLKTELFSVHGQLRHLTFQRHHCNTALLIRLRWTLGAIQIYFTLHYNYRQIQSINQYSFNKSCQTQLKTVKILAMYTHYKIAEKIGSYKVLRSVTFFALDALA